MAQKKKRHKWNNVPHSHLYYNHKKCIYCGLEQAKTYKWYGQVYYFRSDENGNIIEGGIHQKRVPYGCEGSPKNFLLEDELFEI